MSLSPMSHVKFKKWPCRPVDFRGQGPWARQGVHSAMRIDLYVVSFQQKSPSRPRLALAGRQIAWGELEFKLAKNNG